MILKSEWESKTDRLNQYEKKKNSEIALCLFMYLEILQGYLGYSSVPKGFKKLLPLDLPSQVGSSIGITLRK